jgi:hypothetical protein
MVPGRLNTRAVTAQVPVRQPLRYLCGNRSPVPPVLLLSPVVSLSLLDSLLGRELNADPACPEGGQGREG